MPRRPGMIGYRPELNNSYSSFGRLPSPAVSSMNVPSIANGHPLQRTITPMSLQSLRRYNNSAASLAGLPKSPTESSAPRYYDYSESFIEEDCFSPLADDQEANMPFTMNQKIMGDQLRPDRHQATSPFGTMPGSAYRPSELPTMHNRRASEVSKMSKYSYTGVIPPRKSSLAATTTPTLSRSTTQKTLQRSATAEPVFPRSHSKDERDNPRSSTASRRTSASIHASAFFPNASRSPRDLTTLAARVHSPAFDQRTSNHSVSEMLGQVNHREGDAQIGALDGHVQTRPNWELPDFTLRPLSVVECPPIIRERPKTSSDAQLKPAGEVLSPMPERPMSSQSRKRFSRIFEIGENYSVEHTKVSGQDQKFCRLSFVKEQSDADTFAELPVSQQGARHAGAFLNEEPQRPMPPLNKSCEESEDPNTASTEITLHDKSTVESLLDQHIECLGLNGDGSPSFGSSDGSDHSDNGADSSGNSTVKAPPFIRETWSQPSMRPTTSSSYQPSSLASSEQRRLMPRRLFASMDSRLHSRVVPETFRDSSSANLPSAMTSTTINRQMSSGWQILPSTSQLPSLQTGTKVSLTSGDFGDIDSDPPLTKFKVKRHSDLSITPSESTKGSLDTDHELSPVGNHVLHRRSKSDVLARQISHRRRRARIMLKSKRNSTSFGQLTMLDADELHDGEGEPEDEWITTESPEEPSMASPIVGYAELSGESVIVQPSTMISTGSVLLPSSMPRRWTSMLAAMPEPVKKSADVIRKASIRTVRTHRSNTSIIEPLNSTRQGLQLPWLGSVPQLAPPEFGPPLTSSDLNLSLGLPAPPQISRPPLRQAQSFFSDDSSAQHGGHLPRKRFDLHSLRSGLTRSTGLMGTRRSSTRNNVDMTPRQNGNIVVRKSSDYARSSLGDVVPMTDFAYKKRKVFDRFKDWWKRHAC
ncbi:hypothetical protein LTR10_023401 [Elasticomyces elasticus]|uniref:Uncharacterized protein n=1 Tax=Exophiala sideris TaxID=1016849 RepID=A0ABR0IZ08_9EURO|nr:hypothetical protein LTR10_023401 [Elasticomyces elasticus]KAK5022595.1 hypothetical protein LTS07_009818 [Exophiala sideris]KAK5052170.1 hypothetical protein LTR69_009932 [Exophiala sideris]